jgi:hypothetical protein
MKKVFFTLPLLVLFSTGSYAQDCDLMCQLKGTEAWPAEKRVERICPKDTTQSKLCEKLLSDDKYQKLYLETADLINAQNRAVDSTLSDLDKEEQQQEKKLQNMLDKAPRLPDGTIVFVKKDGTLVNKDGNSVEYTGILYDKDGNPLGHYP